MNTCDNIKNIMVSEWSIYKVYAVWFHSDEVQEQTKLTYGDSVKKVVVWAVAKRWEVCVWGGGLKSTGKGHKATIEGMRLNILFWVVIIQGIYNCQNSSIELKMYAFYSIKIVPQLWKLRDYNIKKTLTLYIIENIFLLSRHWETFF